VALPAAAQIEAAGLKAWPALETKRDGSWVLRAANGYTKRANSVQVMNPVDDEDAPARLKSATAWYAERQLPAIFRVTPLTGKKTLAALREGKWEEHDESVVLAMELNRAPRADERAEILAISDPAFLSAQTLIQQYDQTTAAKLGAVLWTMNVPAAGIVFSIYGRPVASALMAIADGIVVTGNVVTAEAERRSGFARAMMETGLAWAFGQGARVAALNMVADNRAASALYQSLGYRHVYDYSYRKAPA
jgi:GNAT superfamily N-acetyltransferase